MKVLVIVARGLQAGALGCYGNFWIDTPALDRLAAGAVVFDQHFADRADPPGAHRAWRSGYYDLPSPDSKSEASFDLLDALRTAGIHTCLVVDESHAAPPAFLGDWDRVERVRPGEDETPLEATLAAAEDALGGLAERDDWLLWIELSTPLPPWQVPEEFITPYFQEDVEEDEEQEDDEDESEEDESEELADEEDEKEEPIEPLMAPLPGVIDPSDDVLYLRLQTSYAAAVSYLDAGVGQLLETLAELPGGDEVVVLCTSDCGQNLGEHGIVGPVRPWLHEEVVHLPLILRLPDGAEAGRRVAALTQTVDLAPTLAGLFAATPGPIHGHDLLPLARGESQEVRVYACSGVQVGEALELALRTPEWAFLLPLLASESAGEPARPIQLYVKPDDHWEVNNVVQHHPDLAEHLERVLREFAAAVGRPGPLEAPVLRGEEELLAQPTTEPAS
jgi:arylsulfatase A-like enzyme